jgi:hypothetical protein
VSESESVLKLELGARVADDEDPTLSMESVRHNAKEDA